MESKEIRTENLRSTMPRRQRLGAYRATLPSHLTRAANNVEASGSSFSENRISTVHNSVPTSSVYANYKIYASRSVKAPKALMM